MRNLLLFLNLSIQYTACSILRMQSNEARAHAEEEGGELYAPACLFVPIVAWITNDAHGVQCILPLLSLNVSEKLIDQLGVITCSVFCVAKLII